MVIDIYLTPTSMEENQVISQKYQNCPSFLIYNETRVRNYEQKNISYVRFMLVQYSNFYFLGYAQFFLSR